MSFGSFPQYYFTYTVNVYAFLIVVYDLSGLASRL